MTSLADAKAACARQAALQQRARLLQAVWDDVQGPRRATRQDVLPGRLLAKVAPDAGWRRAPLDVYAVDLLPCADGVWRVVRDDVGGHPGAGLLQMPLLAAFLPGLSRLLLGEPLRLPSVPVWWLGEPDFRPMFTAYCRRVWVRDGLDAQSTPVHLAGLLPAERLRLQARVAAEPDRFIAGLDTGSAGPTRLVTCNTLRNGPKL